MKKIKLFALAVILLALAPASARCQNSLILELPCLQPKHESLVRAWNSAFDVVYTGEAVDPSQYPGNILPANIGQPGIIVVGRVPGATAHVYQLPKGVSVTDMDIFLDTLYFIGQIEADNCGYLGIVSLNDILNGSGAISVKKFDRVQTYYQSNTERLDERLENLNKIKVFESNRKHVLIVGVAHQWKYYREPDNQNSPMILLYDKEFPCVIDCNVLRDSVDYIYNYANTHEVFTDIILTQDYAVFTSKENSPLDWFRHIPRAGFALTNPARDVVWNDTNVTVPNQKVYSTSCGPDSRFMLAYIDGLGTTTPIYFCLAEFDISNNVLTRLYDYKMRIGTTNDRILGLAYNQNSKTVGMINVASGIPELREYSISTGGNARVMRFQGFNTDLSSITSNDVCGDQAYDVYGGTATDANLFIEKLRGATSCLNAQRFSVSSNSPNDPARGSRPLYDGQFRCNTEKWNINPYVFRPLTICQ